MIAMKNSNKEHKSRFATPKNIYYYSIDSIFIAFIGHSCAQMPQPLQ